MQFIDPVEIFTLAETNKNLFLGLTINFCSVKYSFWFIFIASKSLSKEMDFPNLIYRRRWTF